MDAATAIGSVFAAFGLSGAAGLNPWLPLLASAVLDRLDVVELGAPFEELSTTEGLAALAALFILDFVGDKVPAVDHVLHAVGMVVAPASGAVLFTGQTGLETEIPAGASILLGAVTAGSIHVGRAAARPAATAATVGTGNPVLSLAEDVASGLLVAVAFVVPVIAFGLVVALLVALVVGWRRIAAALRDRRARTGSSV